MSIVKDDKRIKTLKNKIKEETDRNYELNAWGLNSHCIAMTLKIRTLEDLIDCAQRCKLRPDKDVQRELYMMQILRDRIWKDINNFLDKRDVGMSERMQVLSLRKRDIKQTGKKDQNLKQL